MTETPAASRRAALLRNALWWIVLVLIYVVAFRLFMASLHAFPLSVGARMLLGFAFHVAYGVAGYCCFAGPQWLRQILVFTALLANGVILEVLLPSYMYSHLAGMFMFALFSAGGVSLGRLLGKGWAWCRLRLKSRQ